MPEICSKTSYRLKAVTVLVAGLSISSALGGIPSALAREVTDLYIGARSRGMGGTYVAVADDEQTIFLNPAGLAGIKDFRIQISTDLDLSQDILGSYTQSASAFSNFSTKLSMH